jgi:hypothetical protein
LGPSALKRLVPFLFHRLRFHFLAEAPVHFAPGKSGNMLRGAFGSVFRQIACVPHCPGAKRCELRETCAYARIFEPAAGGTGPSGLADPPRPFVFRASHLDGKTIAAGERFHFDVHLFDVAREASLADFIRTFAQLGCEGMGPGRAKAALSSVEQLDAAGRPVLRIFEGRSIPRPAEIQPLSLPLEPLPEAPRRIAVRFLTPTELKSGQQLAARPEFGILLSRIRDRVSTLSALYGAGPLEIDFAAFGQRAGEVRMTGCDLQPISVTRRSSKTGQRHALGGFTGIAEYEGELAAFIPFLVAAQFTGVGRQTTWGKGEIGTELVGLAQP